MTDPDTPSSTDAPGSTDGTPTRDRPRVQTVHSVPGIGGTASTEDASDGRAALRLHIAISAIGGVLSAFVCVLYFVLFDVTALGVVFAVIALASFGWGGWARWRLRRVPARRR